MNDSQNEDIIIQTNEDIIVDKYELDNSLELSTVESETIVPGIDYCGEVEKDPNQNLYTHKPDDSKQLANAGLDYLEEYLMCKMSFLYFLETYVYIPVAGGKIHIGTSPQWNSNPKFKILATLFDQYDAVQFYSSRQVGKTTTALIYYLWCMIYYPSSTIIMITLDSFRGKDAVSRLKAMMGWLPQWMQVEQASKAERTTFYYLSNGSKFDTKFVSGSIDPDTLGRGLSGSLIFIDEGAFIPHMEVVFAAMQPSISTAKKHAEKFGYPFGIITVSTPNGAGNNWFYQILHNSISFDDIYDYENKKMYDNYEEILDNDEKNAFISIRIHWSETDRDEDWYKTQCKELNFNMRKINQELDLVFLGSDSSIFSDDIISKLTPIKSYNDLTLPFGNKLKLYLHEFDLDKKYIMGVDTAMSTGIKSDSSAIVITDAYTGEQVASWKGKFSVVKRFAALVRSCIRGLNNLYGLNEETLTVVIERNSIGKEVVEELLYPPSEDEFEYHLYLYQEKAPGNSEEYVYGFYTSNAGKMGQGKRDQMMNNLMTQINEFPDRVHDNDTIEELRNLVQKPNGRIEADKGSHDDLVLSYCFTLYVKNIWIKTGEIIIEGNNYSAYAIKTDTISNYLDVCLSDSNEIIRAQQEIDNQHSSGYVYISDKEDKTQEIRFQNDLSNFIII